MPKINLTSTEIKLYAKTTVSHHRIWILCPPITSVSDPYLFPGQNLNTDPYVKLIIFLTKKENLLLTWAGSVCWIRIRIQEVADYGSETLPATHVLPGFRSAWAGWFLSGARPCNTPGLTCRHQTQPCSQRFLFTVYYYCRRFTVAGIGVIFNSPIKRRIFETNTWDQKLSGSIKIPSSSVRTKLLSSF